MSAFRWISGRDIPAQFDLQLKRWTLTKREEQANSCVSLVDAKGLAKLDWMRLLASHSREARRFMLVCGVDKAEDRASLLEFGFGDCVIGDVALVELEARARRLATISAWVPRSRKFDRLELDLLSREALVDGKSLDLGPREFALLWRLADAPGETISKEALFDDVWRLGYVPESNSVAVHMSRLRGKLTASGLAGIVETAGGGYRLRAAQREGALPMLRLRRHSRSAAAASQPGDGPIRHH